MRKSNNAIINGHIMRLALDIICLLVPAILVPRYGHTVVGPTNVIQESKSDKSVSLKSQAQLLEHIYRYEKQVSVQILFV